MLSWVSRHVKFPTHIHSVLTAIVNESKPNKLKKVVSQSDKKYLKYIHQDNKIWPSSNTNTSRVCRWTIQSVAIRNKGKCNKNCDNKECKSLK